MLRHDASHSAVAPHAATRPGATTTNGEAPVSAGVPLVMPNQDLTITEGVVVSWLKQPGDPVTKGEGVVEVETDKAVMTVESPEDGVLSEILAPEQATVKLGESLGIVRPLVREEIVHD
jgi:biotin carboxyl carrier protein